MTSLGRDRKKELDDLLGDIDSGPLWGGFTGELAKLQLANKIEDALGFAEPKGDPGHIAGKARDYANASSYVSTVHGDVKAVARAGLPAVWVGEAGSKASDVTDAAAYSADQMAEKFAKAGRELQMLSTGIQDAKGSHSRGMDALHAARGYLGDNPAFASDDEAAKAKAAAQEGVRMLRTAVERAEDAGERAARELDKLTSEARAGKLDSDHLSAADRITLADAAAHGGDRDANEILTANDLRRSGTRLDEMSESDRKAFDGMLDGAKSPEERAYLMKALASGYDLDHIQDFRDQIHPHGDDPAWLQQHLTPIASRPEDSKAYGNQDADVSFGPQRWEQEGPTCVAMSTVTAHAATDPLYALELTTGGHPGDPEYDNPEAFEERMRDEETRVYDVRDDKDQEGMTDDESEEIADDEIGEHTGSDYENRELDDSGDREDALPEIRDSVNAGRPVPVSVRGEDSGHQMMIIGQEGDRLQIYNPWGFTTWVSEDDFINGNMAGASDDRLPTPTSVRLPE